MTRSTFTNQLIKSLLENGRNFLSINDGKEVHSCWSFKQAIAVIDSVNEVTISVHRKTDNYAYGWLQLVMSNTGTEQLHDHSANDYFERHVMPLYNKYDSILGRM